MRLCTNPECQIVLVQRDNEPDWKFDRRRFCSRRCAAICRPRETIEKIAASNRANNATEQGQESRQEAARKRKQFFADNPASFQAMIDSQTKTRHERGHAQKVSEWTRDFYETDAGLERKDRFRQMYSGKKRMHLSEKIREGVRRFWDSPAGEALRVILSERRTDGLPEAPFGPGWKQAAYRARQRDKVCAICGRTPEENGQALDVHHIYARRAFGYVPGQNENFRWANNLANLCSLCDSCHRRVEMRVVKVPSDFQEMADALWNEFVGHPPAL